LCLGKKKAFFKKSAQKVKRATVTVYSLHTGLPLGRNRGEARVTAEEVGRCRFSATSGRGTMLRLVKQWEDKKLAR